jgi:hypothetical protein
VILRSEPIENQEPLSTFLSDHAPAASPAAEHRFLRFLAQDQTAEVDQSASLSHPGQRLPEKDSRFFQKGNPTIWYRPGPRAQEKSLSVWINPSKKPFDREKFGPYRCAYRKHFFRG